MKRGKQLVARQRHDGDMHLEEPGLEPFVHFVLEQLQRLVADAALDTLVDEVLRPIEDHARAYQAALDHGVEVAGERCLQHGTRFRRQGIVRRPNVR